MKAEEAAFQPSRRQLTWFLFFRVLVVTIFLGGAAVYQWRSLESATISSLSSIFFVLGSLYYLQALIASFLLPRARRFRLFIQSQIAWDLVFVACLTVLTGGLKSFFSFLFVLIILSSSVFLGRREILVVASAAAILYGSLLDLQFYGYLPEIGGMGLNDKVDARDFFYAIFIHVMAFFLTGLLGGTLSERLRKSEQALEKKEIDFEELERLNRTILDNITSGLMIVNAAGRIRSFNAAASRITGFSLEEIYNRDIRELFPAMPVFQGTDFAVVRRREGSILDRHGKRRTLGYATSLVEDPEGISLLITFQDLTHLKEMEDQLKRADRLAAVGKLASGMAHEIRNPLASISGSVQLLMDAANIRVEDRRLMQIVVKEADRLSGLLNDFLVYARPRAPQPSFVDAAALLDEMVEMLYADKRFAAVEIRREYSPGTVMRFDREQIHQSLLNLAINAAEAMGPSGGCLTLGLDERTSALFVEDTGPGIPEAIRERIFDPFFTTKDSGTGLGLATVYAIVEAHGGHIRVTPGRNGFGTRFTLRLPGRAQVEAKPGYASLQDLPALL